MGYNVQANNRAIYKKIIADANMRDQLPENCTLRVDFLGRRTSEAQAVKQPAMVVTYNSEDLVYTGLKLKAALKANDSYKRVFFCKSVPPEYKDAYNRMDKIRQSFYNVRDGGRRIYEARIDFISCYMCLKVKTLIQHSHTPWAIYQLWAPGYDDFKPVSRPVVQQIFMPVIVGKIIPYEGNNTISNADKEGVGNKYREKLDQTIKHKCISGLWNDRGSVYTMSFKFNCKEDLEALKKMEQIYKEECHVHQFNIPFETAIWMNDEGPLRRPQNTPPNVNSNPESQQTNALTTSTDQQGAQSSNSGSEQNISTEQQNLAALPQRVTQNRGDSLQA